MAVRRLRKNQKGPWCSYCEAKTERAVYRGCGFESFACSQHFESLKKDDDAEAEYDSYQTEAEFQLDV